MHNNVSKWTKVKTLAGLIPRMVLRLEEMDLWFLLLRSSNQFPLFAGAQQETV